MVCAGRGGFCDQPHRKRRFEISLHNRPFGFECFTAGSGHYHKPAWRRKVRSFEGAASDSTWRDQHYADRRLLGSHELSDEKPSVFLQKLRNLAAGQVTDEILRTIFMEQLPENVRAILAISEVSDLGRLVAQADKVMEVAKPSQALQTVQAVNTTTGNESEIAELRKQIELLGKQIRERRRSRCRGKGDFRQRRSQSKTQKEEEHCYHRKVGDKAYKCDPPCAWDTGADISAIPRSMVRGKCNPTDLELFAANNTKIRTYGSKTRILNLGLRRSFTWDFLVADIR
ncbi:hypothetical protein DMN91_007466 [Ooceraea biroi]|uniref:Peptidase A2 domain-containing protein n=1 Tax=Ooceraea biroi TaxID=2015173 RepID=A0A3L8DL08_OOCBI|nr:hypothetical protein DMN91_007466 [Ooceraea biroi]